MNLLVVEDNEELAKGISDELKKHFCVEVSRDGDEAYYLISQNIYDFIVLDLMLPNKNGMEILKDIRAKNIDTPVIILTAKEELGNKLEAFKIGVNDYMTKPFYTEELIARIYNILRTTGKMESENTLKFKELVLDLNKRSLSIQGKEIELQNKQFNLLEYFLLNRGSILLKEQIYDRIWGIESDSTLEIVEVYISNLRKKLSKFGYDKYIKTKRKVGYIFDEDK
ncbi:MAG: response regulator transcription factor [Clostridioides sp.]|nr:response regulator transcription factor [Clostridioides sp.]